MLDLLFVIFRFPFGIVASLTLLCSILVAFIIETVALIATFPFAVVLMPRNSFSKSWYSKYPNSLKTPMWQRIPEIWGWVFLRIDKLSGEAQGCVNILAFAVFIMFFLVLVIPIFN